MAITDQPIVYSACFGDHDVPSDETAMKLLSIGVESHCFTDNPDHIESLPHWRVHLRPQVFKTRRMDAKWYKMSACHLFPDRQWSIYLDASVRVKDAARLVHEASTATEAAFTGGLALFLHPEDPHRSLEEEAWFSMTFAKYAGEPCVAQVAHYRAAGLPPGDRSYRLYAGGVIARLHSRNIERLEKTWFDECVHWSSQDQLSLPFALWLTRGYRDTPGIIPGCIYDCDFLGRVWSGPNK